MCPRNRLWLRFTRWFSYTSSKTFLKHLIILIILFLKLIKKKKVGEKVVTLDCSAVIECHEQGELTALDITPCSTNGTCLIENNSATCKCNEGYFGDGYVCDSQIKVVTVPDVPEIQDIIQVNTTTPSTTTTTSTITSTPQPSTNARTGCILPDNSILQVRFQHSKFFFKYHQQTKKINRLVKNLKHQTACLFTLVMVLYKTHRSCIYYHV